MSLLYRLSRAWMWLGILLASLVFVSVALAPTVTEGESAAWTGLIPLVVYAPTVYVLWKTRKLRI